MDGEQAGTQMPPEKKRSEPRTLTRQTVESYFGLFEQAIGQTACKVLHERGAAEHWHKVLTREHVSVDELAAALNAASERGAPYQGISIAWVMGMIRDYRNRRREEAERQQRLPKGTNVLRDANVKGEDAAEWRRLKALSLAVGATQRDTHERLTALKNLHEALYGPNARLRGPIGGGYAREIARLEKKLAEQDAAQARDEAFVTQAGGDASKLEDIAAKRKAVQAEPTKMTFDDEIPF